jgi:hypothetical protein
MTLFSTAKHCIGGIGYTGLLAVRYRKFVPGATMR